MAVKKYFIFLFVLTTVAGACQSEVLEKIEVVGTWSLTDFNEAGKFQDTWNFTSEGGFNELKQRSDVDTTWVTDEYGAWTLEGKRLRIIVSGEHVRGKQELYKKPEIVEFEIKKEGSDFILIVLADRGANEGKTTRLRLAPKKYDR